MQFPNMHFKLLCVTLSIAATGFCTVAAAKMHNTLLDVIPLGKGQFVAC